MSAPKPYTAPSGLVVLTIVVSLSAAVLVSIGLAVFGEYLAGASLLTIACAGTFMAARLDKAREDRWHSYVEERKRKARKDAVDEAFRTVHGVLYPEHPIRPGTGWPA